MIEVASEVDRLASRRGADRAPLIQRGGLYRLCVAPSNPHNPSHVTRHSSRCPSRLRRSAPARWRPALRAGRASASASSAATAPASPRCSRSSPGTLQLDDGELQRRDGLRIAFVEQEPQLAACRNAARKPARATQRLARGRDASTGACSRGSTNSCTASISTASARRTTASGGERKRAALALALRAAARPAAARRADQPSRHRRHRAARGAAAEGAGEHRHHPRPRLPRPRHHAHRGARSRRAALLSRQLRGVRSAQERRARGRGSRQPPLRQVLGAGRGVDPQRRRSAPHAQRRPRAAPRAPARRARRAARAARQRAS